MSGIKRAEDEKKHVRRETVEETRRKVGEKRRGRGRGRGGGGETYTGRGESIKEQQKNPKGSSNELKR